jgi:hypothetical protein
MTGTGVRDPEEPDQWLVEPWPADASFDEVARHFLVASTTHAATCTSIACLLVFHESLQAALAAAPTEELRAQDSEERGYKLGCVDLGVIFFRALYTAAYGRDPQASEDQHVHAVKHRDDPQSPGP